MPLHIDANDPIGRNAGRSTNGHPSPVSGSQSERGFLPIVVGRPYTAV